LQKMQQLNDTFMSETKDIIIYQTDEGETQLEVNLQKETVWLNLNQLSDLLEGINLLFQGIYGIFLKPVNWNRRQLLQILQQFKPRVTGK
jgi:hypothetical protein